MRFLTVTGLRWSPLPWWVDLWQLVAWLQWITSVVRRRGWRRWCLSAPMIPWHGILLLCSFWWATWCSLHPYKCCDACLRRPWNAQHSLRTCVYVCVSLHGEAWASTLSMQVDKCRHRRVTRVYLSSITYVLWLNGAFYRKNNLKKQNWNNCLCGIEWSRDWWPHLTVKGQGRDPSTLRAQYLENSWRWYLATMANY